MPSTRNTKNLLRERERDGAKLDATDALWLCHTNVLMHQEFSVLCELCVTQSEHGIIMAACPTVMPLTADYSCRGRGQQGLLLPMLALLVGGIVSTV